MALQAWTESKKVHWKTNWADGHYVVAVGYDRHKVYFADPSSIYPTFLTFAELEERWHDIDNHNGRRYEHYGLAVTGAQPRAQRAIHMD